MSVFIKELVLNKMRNLTTQDIVKNARKYDFTISEEEAKHINNYLKNNKVDPFKERDRKIMLKELAKITDTETAKKANKLFLKLIKQYGLESMMD
ncbi:DUF2624 domain-containing protein [Ornithinibacillus halophilus]|uniref:DUF2624 domain-containing protein n=1 Tax=Ornithinibacillus halophilus TaxID=930117 RepID=A0A1M5D3D5_9BACI|nr:DUF2624 family protein [Ornithinibacillus halophilus]SHF61486.1 Protein of unknown function [Ornithinibacillus halophilus]